MYQNVNSSNSIVSTNSNSNPQQQQQQNNQIQISQSTAYGGLNAEEKSSYVNQSVLSGYIKGISSYIPSSIKSSIKKQISSSPVLDGNDKDTLVGTFFDECEIQFEKHKLLINCYNNGFQVWDLNHAEGVKEILSIRETGFIKFCKVLANPLEKDDPSSNFYGVRPLLAVVSGEDNSKVSRNMVRIFSLQTTELVNMYKFRTPIYNVLSNKHLVLICLKERIVGFNPLTMNKELSLPCYPSINPMGVIALGSRWIAYIDYETSHLGALSMGLVNGMGGGTTGKSQNQTFSDTAVDVATDLAKEVAQKLYYFGDIGRKKVQTYLNGNQTGGGSGSSSIASDHHISEDSLSISPNSGMLSSFVGAQPEVGRVIVVYDYVKRKPVSVIKPSHSQPISYLTFDQSGTLLFSASTEGTKINAYRIIPFTNSLVISSPNTFSHQQQQQQQQQVGDSTHRQIYVLKRGITNATIQGISVNETSKWVSLTTSRGTTHLFAINPLGGEVDIHTHITKSPQSKSNGYNHYHQIDYYSNSVRNLIPNLLTLNAMDRIKLGNESQQEDSGKIVQSSFNSFASGAGASCFIESDTPNVEKLFVCSPTGQLILFEIRPTKPPLNSEMNENSLCLSIQAVSEWDVCRKTRHPEFKLPNIPTPFTDSSLHHHRSAGGFDHYNQMKQLDDEARWLYNVEIVTHSQDIKAVWGIPQFSFRSISSFDPSALNKPFFDIDYPDSEPIKLEKKKPIISPKTYIDNHQGNDIPNVNYQNTDHFSNNNNAMLGGFTAINSNDSEDDMEMIIKINEAIETSISPKFDDYQPINYLSQQKFEKQSTPIINNNNSNNNKYQDYSNYTINPDESLFEKPTHSNIKSNRLDNDIDINYPILNKSKENNPPIPTIPTLNNKQNREENNSTTSTTTTTTPIAIPSQSKKLPITKTQPTYSDYDDLLSPSNNGISNSSGSSNGSNNSLSPKLPFSSPPKQSSNSKGKRK